MQIYQASGIFAQYSYLTNYMRGSMTHKIIQVLAVEDEKLNQTMLQFIFSQAHIAIEIVETGKAALEIMNSRHDEFHLVLMDLGLPDMNGIQVTQKIRQNENINGLKAIFICAYTGDNTPEKQQECFEAGMNAFITKPMSMENFSIFCMK